MRTYHVYIMSSLSRTLYVGITSKLERRVVQHKEKLLLGFSARYNVTQLVYFESTEDVSAAISREKQIKAWRREKKIALIEAINPDWNDLSEDW